MEILWVAKDKKLTKLAIEWKSICEMNVWMYEHLIDTKTGKTKKLNI